MIKLTFSPHLSKKLSRLQKIDSPCSQLFYKGVDINEFVDRPTVAIVGSRKPSPYGIAQTKKISEQLARAGVVIVSGLAHGIDAIAHNSALDANGDTISVLPSDVETIYPATNRLLAKRIIDSGGALLSEYESNALPRKVDFLIRNRIVAALSDAVIVTEAAAQSGTLNTARHAREMEIPVFALPGNVTSPMSAGCNWLIKNGAFLLTESNDILNHLKIEVSPQRQLDLSTNSPEETLVLQKISLGYTLTDELLRETAMELGTLQEILTILEIDGKVHQTIQGSWNLR